MSEANLSDYEKLFLLHGVQDGQRLDGRNCEDYRPISVEFDYISNSYGSCQLKLGDTKVVASIKAEVVDPSTTTPNLGKIEFYVDCSANATPAFQGRGGDEISSQIISTLDHLFSVDNFDLSQLSIVSGKKCWHVFVDIVLLECCGNLCDACSLAAKFALSKAKFPKLIARSDDEGQIEIDVADDPLAIQTINVDNVPYSISVNKIGHNYIVDADLKEEAVTKVRIIFGIDRNGHIRYSNKDGFGSLDPDTLYAMVDLAKDASENLNKIFIKSSLNERNLF